MAADDADAAAAAATPTYHQKLSAIASFIRKQTDQSSMDTQKERERERDPHQFESEQASALSRRRMTK